MFLLDQPPHNLHGAIIVGLKVIPEDPRPLQVNKVVQGSNQHLVLQIQATIMTEYKEMPQKTLNINLGNLETSHLSGAISLSRIRI